MSQRTEHKFTAVPQGVNMTVALAGHEYKVIAVDQYNIPLLDIPMMSDERCTVLCSKARAEHPEVYALYDQLVAEGYQGNELIEIWCKRIFELHQRQGTQQREGSVR